MIHLHDDRLQLDLDAAHGGSWRALRWRHPDGFWRDLLLPLHGDGFDGGNFIMAPFCNRIRDGAFTVNGQHYQLPINQPDEGMAIHGQVRDRPWQICAQAPQHVRLALTLHDTVWHYRIEQQISIADDQITAELRIKNLATRAMPFGIGFHPWFPRQPQSQVTFASSGAHRQDDRALPLSEQDRVEGLDPHHPLPLNAIRPLDHCFSGWTPREADITWPEAQCHMRLTTSGALRHLQLYTPQGQSYFCLEPVSHLPDAINRPVLAASAQMEMLPPQGEMQGSMSLSLRPI